MIQDALDNLTHSDADTRLRASVEVGDFASRLKTLDFQTAHDFERLRRQAHSYSDWPEHEQHRFRMMIQGVRVSAKKEGKLFDSKGFPIWD